MSQHECSKVKVLHEHITMLTPTHYEKFITSE